MCRGRRRCWADRARKTGVLAQRDRLTMWRVLQVGKTDQRVLRVQRHPQQGQVCRGNSTLLKKRLFLAGIVTRSASDGVVVRQPIILMSDPILTRVAGAWGTAGWAVVSPRAQRRLPPFRSADVWLPRRFGSFASLRLTYSSARPPIHLSIGPPSEALAPPASSPLSTPGRTRPPDPSRPRSTFPPATAPVSPGS